ncbi:nuclear transport factor 2 family protein [Diaphorobacter caeni]|uniref:nuclear transport factor 2 family protein n=1 Tax=Diaphorobacter caeni TaxID=2784387 RepID=UPI00188E143C|nr:nuclear transport factor 2 family protein [Diaphorobacter caeni]MBF5002939.1 ester cyclase [Diaphorobacter caeni]
MLHANRFRTQAGLVLIAAALTLSACGSKRAESRRAAVATQTAQVGENRNKASAMAFYNEFFNQHDLSAADRYIGDTYIQHNPRVANGREAFKSTFAQIFKQNPGRRSTIARAVAEGDLVMLHVHTVTGPGDRGSAIVDIFRFDANGKIVEHWDVIQPVPDKTASGNGMF